MRADQPVVAAASLIVSPSVIGLNLTTTVSRFARIEALRRPSRPPRTTYVDRRVVLSPPGNTMRARGTPSNGLETAVAVVSDTSLAPSRSGHGEPRLQDHHRRRGRARVSD